MARSLTGKVAYNTGIQLTGRLINMVISLVTVAILARYLGIEGFGLFTIILTFVGVVGILGDLGLGTQLIKEATKPGADLAKVTSEFIGIRVVTATLLSVFGFTLAWVLYGVVNPYPATTLLGIGLGLVGVWFNHLASILTSILQVRLKLYLISASDVLARSVQLGILLWLVNIKADLLSIVATMVVGNIIYLASLYIFTNREIPITVSVNYSYWLSQLKLALPLSIITILGTVHYRLDLVLLSLLKDSTSVAIYGLPYKVIDVLILLPGSFIAAVFPIFASYAQLGEDLKSGYQKSFDLMAFFAMPAVAGIIVLANPVMILIGGGEYYDSPALLQILGLSLAASFLTTIGRALLISKDLQKRVVLAFVGVVLLNAGLNLALIPQFSYFGAAWATLISEGVLLVIEMWLLYKYLHLWPSLSILLRATICSIIMAGVLIGLGNFNLHLFLLVPLGALVYFVTMYLVGGLKLDTMRALVR